MIQYCMQMRRIEKIWTANAVSDAGNVIRIFGGPMEMFGNLSLVVATGAGVYSASHVLTKWHEKNQFY